MQLSISYISYLMPEKELMESRQYKLDDSIKVYLDIGQRHDISFLISYSQ